MQVIVFTDGSYNQKENLSGWGFILETSTGTQLEASGICPDFVNTSVQSELYAIMEATQYINRNFPLANKIEIFTDCSSLCITLDPTWRKIQNPVSDFLKREILKNLRKDGVSSEVIHVPSHQKDNSKSSRMNNRVDYLAKKERKSYSKEMGPVIRQQLKDLNKSPGLRKEAFNHWKKARQAS